MAVAGIDNVTALERWDNQERPITRTSFIRKMWHDLEEETKNREIRSRMGSQCSCSSEGGESENVWINTSELENECPGKENQMEMGIRNGDEDNASLCLQQSPAIGTADEERVRQVFREWGSKNGSGRVLKFPRKNNCSRNQSFCENECNRVRTVRQWIESNTQQAESGSFVIEEQVLEVASRKSVPMLYGRHDLLDLLKSFAIGRQKEIQSLLENGPVSNFAHRNRLQSLLRGRFLWNQRFVQDKKSTSVAASELGILRQNTVSDLRKGFLSRSDNNEQSNRSDTSSDNGSKYHQENIQELPDDLVINREGTYEVDSETETCCTSREIDAPAGKSLERVLENEREQPLLPTEMVECQDSDQDQDQDQESLVERNQGVHYIEPFQQTLEIGISRQSPPPSPSIILYDQYQSDEDELEVHDAFDPSNPSETNKDILFWQEAEEWQEPVTENNDIEWHHLTNPESNEGSDANSIENEDEWYQGTAPSDDDDANNAESWLAPPVVRTDAFYTSDNSDRPELRELMSRRRVSNLLQSDFRVRLDQLIQSYVERQEQESQSDGEWMLDHKQQDPEQQSVGENDDVREAIESAEGLQTSPTAIPQQSGTEWEIINGLRFDMVRLQEQMNSMQNTLEACMKMQHELRRLVQLEVSSALSRLSNSGKDSFQTCVLWCENSSSDSSPDRSGHVYVCSNCAEKINWSKLKESVKHP